LKDFRDLEVWVKAHQLTLSIYRATASFPTEEKYGLTGQLRRSAASIPSNISEGCGRGGDRELARFLQIAMGSASELEYQLLLCQDLGFLQGSVYKELEKATIEVKRMLTSLIRKLTAES
jgi:four helix bundle protein